MNATPDTATKMHPWEKLGLGLAPFRCLGVERRVGPIRQYDANGEPTGLECGYPGQPMGTCDACGQGIADCYLIRSADKKRFIVGCDCAAKVFRDDGGHLERDVRRHRLAIEHSRDDARIASAVALLDRPEVVAYLEAAPHPKGNANRNALQFVEYVMEKCSRTAKIRAARIIEAAAAELVTA